MTRARRLWMAEGTEDCGPLNMVPRKRTRTMGAFYRRYGGPCAVCRVARDWHDLAPSDHAFEPVHSVRNVQCPECGRVFDPANATDANELTYGHDCEVLF